MTLIFIIFLFLSIVVHEYSHAWTAYMLGDPTPKNAGRLTLNPLRHIDPFGTVALPFLLLVATGGNFVFGYAKPVPINARNFKNPRKDILWVGLAGPLSNFVCALFLAIFAKLPFPEFIRLTISYVVALNLLLCIINLLPIPPLDGSNILASFLSYKNASRYMRMRRFWIIILIVLVLTDFLDWFVLPLVRSLLMLLGVRGIAL